MSIVCDNCKKGNKGFYVTFELEGKFVTWCRDCRGISTNNKDKKLWEHINTPFWVHSGAKPNAQEKAQLRYMKSCGMSWGDLRRERDFRNGTQEGGLKQWQKAIK